MKTQESKNSDRKLTKKDIGSRLLEFMPEGEVKFRLHQTLSGQQTEIERLQKNVAHIPAIDAQKGKLDHALAYVRYFIGSTEIFLTEANTETGDAYGFMILDGDSLSEGLGHQSLKELRKTNGLLMDYEWTVKTLREVKGQHVTKKAGRPYELGDGYQDNFDWKGMYRMALTTDINWSKENLKSLLGSFKENNAHHSLGYLLETAIQMIDSNPDFANRQLAKFHDGVSKELGDNPTLIKEETERLLQTPVSMLLNQAVPESALLLKIGALVPSCFEKSDDGGAEYFNLYRFIGMAQIEVSLSEYKDDADAVGRFIANLVLGSMDIEYVTSNATIFQSRRILN